MVRNDEDNLHALPKERQREANFRTKDKKFVRVSLTSYNCHSKAKFHLKENVSHREPWSRSWRKS